MIHETAEDLAISALQFIAGDENTLSQFLSLTGLSVDEMRNMSKDEAFFGGILEFLLGHEPTLLAFAAHANLDPASVQKAYLSLNPDGQMEF